MFKDKKVILGVTGSIAAYKAAEIASYLNREGAEVDVVMTESATRFISPLTMRTLTGRPVVTSMWEMTSEFSIEHVSLAHAADVVLIAPATANIIAHLAAGMADDILTATVLATKAPVVLAPAMNVNMYENSITQENISRLKKRGFGFVEPGFGRLATGIEGQGRLADVEFILAATARALGRGGDLEGKSLLVTAGGTREPLDPVRFIGNRSSGKMGHAVAEAARDRGADVTLITTASYNETVGIKVISVSTAAQMRKAVKKETAATDALIMVAAVADYTPKDAALSKIKKDAAGLELELTRTVDILAESKGSFIKVGFAAESESMLKNAAKKLKDKGLDLIIANNIMNKQCGFGTDINKVTIIDSKGKVEELPLMTKRNVADKILDKVALLFKA